ncbi:transcriptional regulator GfcR [Halomarina litorea]|uniref:transcriptional regulator GfcR n=1 Tax=Halomarina litorea TaxID=2961595 RepID=UPI0020C42166|nr:transcriptional regulator GfcR [Halomarina sp. BCD28]
MKNVDDLIENASALAERGLSKGEIADELNVSRETARWLVERGNTTTTRTASEPDDIHVDWSAVGSGGDRLEHVGKAMADLLRDANGEVDVTVGIEKAGVPLATTVGRELATDLATYTPAKHQWEEGELDDRGGSFSRNFAPIEGRDCYVVDDTVTSGTTLAETVRAVREHGGNPVACVVLVDKRGVDEVEGVPVHSLIQVIRVGTSE